MAIDTYTITHHILVELREFTYIHPIMSVFNSEIKKCNNCKKSIASGTWYCPYCGRKQVSFAGKVLYGLIITAILVIVLFILLSL